MATRKIADLSRVATPAASDLVIIETTSGTKAVTYENFVNQAMKQARIDEAELRTAVGNVLT